MDFHIKHKTEPLAKRRGFPMTSPLLDQMLAKNCSNLRGKHRNKQRKTHFPRQEHKDTYITSKINGREELFLINEH